MSLSSEGEILFTEKYGSSSSERYYVKPPGQSSIVVIDRAQTIPCYSWNWLLSVFLPQGYPDSVSSDYIPYQLWDTAQAFCSTIAGTLATHEVLKGVGVGDQTATPLAATVTWILKEGCGHIGRICFAYSHGFYLDAYSKRWRLYADTLNDAAMCIEIALPMFKKYTVFALCVSTVMKAIVGVAGGATRVAMTQHHALRGNMADVAAKDSAQETAVNLIASVVALFVISTFGNSLLIFLLMIVLHITCNYLAVRAVCLRTLNEPRFLQLINMYLLEEVVPTPCEINRIEPIMFPHSGPNCLDYRFCGFKIIMGYSFKKILKHTDLLATHILNIQDIYQNRNYLLYINTDRRLVYVILNEKADSKDVLCSYFHAVLLSIIVSCLNDVPLSVCETNGKIRPFAEVCQTLKGTVWSRLPKETVRDYCLAYDPSYELLKYVDKIVQNEWVAIVKALRHTGWDLDRHLLITDEWRISSHHNQEQDLLADPVVSTTSHIISPKQSFIDSLNDVSSMTNIIEPDGSIHSVPEKPSEDATLTPEEDKQTTTQDISTESTKLRAQANVACDC